MNNGLQVRRHGEGQVGGGGGMWRAIQTLGVEQSRAQGLHVLTAQLMPGQHICREVAAGEESCGQLQGVAQGMAAIWSMAGEVGRHRMAMRGQGNGVKSR